eukprot:c17585_g1_i1 orf=394-717(-)
MRASLVSLARAAAAPPKSTAAGASKRLSGLLKPLRLSPALQKVVGASELSRGETMKRIWAYIKENKLQSESSKKIIVCDERLKAVFGQESLSFLEVAKLLNPNFIKV